VDVIIEVNISGVYNPFYDYVDVLESIKNNQDTILIIDQEGYNAEITFKIEGKNCKIITSTTCKSCEKFPDNSGLFLKSEVIEKMKKRLLNIYEKNKEEMNDYIYPLNFDYEKLESIKS